MKILPEHGSKRCVILQPTFMPWAGFFDLIDQADIFVILDDVQFSKQSWQQRNQLRGPSGLAMISMPVKIAGKGPQLINEVELADKHAITKLNRTLKSYYSKAPYFEKLFPSLEKSIELGSSSGKLIDLNISIIYWILNTIGLSKKTVRSSELLADGKRGAYVAEICSEVGATVYISPSGAENYLIEDQVSFSEKNIEIRLQNYSHPTYKQCFSPFIPYASILDLIFNTGDHALNWLRKGRRPAREISRKNTSCGQYYAIRVDASTEIGSGHLMRCLTLARQLKNSGAAQVHFISRKIPDTLRSIINENGFRLHLLEDTEGGNSCEDAANLPAHANWLGADWRTDAEQTRQAINEIGGVDVLIVDHYAIDKQWEQAIHDCVRLLCVIDDLADRQHDCDVLLDQDYFQDPMARYQDLIPPHCTALLGPAHALLREEFHTAVSHLNPKNWPIKNVLVYYGASDVNNLTALTLDALNHDNYKDFNIDVVVGATYPYLEQLRTQASFAQNIRIHVQIKNMAEIMAKADLAFGACGTTTWERCLLGIPSIVSILADNQRAPTQQLAKVHAVVNLGEAEDVTIDRMRATLDELLADPDRYQAISKACSALMQQGQLSLHNVLTRPLPFRSGSILLRSVTQWDKHDLLHWRNQPVVRAWSRTQEIITEEQHERWINEIISSPNQYLFIGYRNEIPVGVVRFDQNFDSGEISIYLTPKGHGKGNGSALLQALENWIIQHMHQTKKIIAVVLDMNERSHELFRKNGFQQTSEIYEKWIER